MYKNKNVVVLLTVVSSTFLPSNVIVLTLLGWNVFKMSLFIYLIHISSLDILNPPHVLPAQALISIKHRHKIRQDVG